MINRLQKPLHGSAFVPILKDPADVLTNIIVLLQDAPDFYDKHKRKVTTLGDRNSHTPTTPVRR